MLLKPSWTSKILKNGLFYSLNSIQNYTPFHGEFYCVFHSKQQFRKKGNSDEGFGVTQNKIWRKPQSWSRMIQSEFPVLMWVTTDRDISQPLFYSFKSEERSSSCLCPQLVTVRTWRTGQMSEAPVKDTFIFFIFQILKYQKTIYFKNLLFFWKLIYKINNIWIFTSLQLI